TFLISLFLAHPTRMFVRTPTDRHPERSASRIDRLTEGLQRVVEGPRGCLLADALYSFPATKTIREIKKSQPPSEAEGSAAQRTFRGNVFRQSVAQWRDLRFPFIPPAPSIQPNQIRLALTRLKTTRNLNRASLVVTGRPDAHPMTGRARKLDHLRSTIFPRQLVPQFIRSALTLESANLHAPASSAVERRRSSKYFHSHPGHPRPPHANCLRGCQGKIEHAVGNERPTIGNTQDDRLSSRKVGHPDQRIHRQRAVGRGQSILVEDLAVSPAPLVIRRPVPAGGSLFAVNHRVRRDECSVRLIISDRTRYVRRRGRAGNRRRRWSRSNWSRSSQYRRRSKRHWRGLVPASGT
ncbi:MAG: hypothetical protein QOI94_1034, partial [Acidobacteriaceae bacterium]|nr:hypothetical protein [Acidobacteriaceae bacterium]